MGVRVVITFEGLNQVVGRLEALEKIAPENIEKQMARLAKATEVEWRGATPKRTGKLQSGDKVQPDGFEFTLENPVHYYKFVDEGHMTPAGWRTRRGYRPAKRRSHVAGRDITKTALNFVEQNILDYLSKFLDDA